MFYDHFKSGMFKRASTETRTRKGFLNLDLRPRCTTDHPIAVTSNTYFSREAQERLAQRHDRLQAKVTTGKGYFKWKRMSAKENMKREEELMSEGKMSMNKSYIDFREVAW